MNQSNPFRKDDVVYHPTGGKAKVHELYTAEQVKVQFDKHSYRENDYHCAHVMELSFEPWPAPEHERPFEPTLKENDQVVAILKRDTAIKEFFRVKQETPEHVVPKATDTDSGRYLSKDKYNSYKLVKFN